MTLSGIQRLLDYSPSAFFPSNSQDSLEGFLIHRVIENDGYVKSKEK